MNVLTVEEEMAALARPEFRALLEANRAPLQAIFNAYMLIKEDRVRGGDGPHVSTHICVGVM